MDKVTEKIVSLVPELAICSCEEDEASCLTHNGGFHAPIRLADVLRAIQYEEESLPCHLWHDGLQLGSQMNHLWNLTTDYDNQTQEVKDFIGNLLNV